MFCEINNSCKEANHENGGKQDEISTTISYVEITNENVRVKLI